MSDSSTFHVAEPTERQLLGKLRALSRRLERAGYLPMSEDAAYYRACKHDWEEAVTDALGPLMQAQSELDQTERPRQWGYEQPQS